ncbi:C10 family peptidase [Prevotella melaninogenica]|uniref:C10 family peptidase n=1 Tax=Prevotella melaninogenica TaxID=28132 RepID=UPI001BAB61B3|nr:C10 family peptidase [Prevotella melaninogenica]QUB56518.1 C10 family peptidase [Prevotella melaninogenica]QUB57845.1 C10 family peptidase [Prevotella melaninogenica]
MKRTLLLVLTAFSNILLANAEPITKARALSIATKYINNPKLSNDTPKTRSSQANEQPAYYIFTNPNDKKFVIISGESKLNELVGYGDKMTENPNDQPPYFKLFLKEYERVVKEVRSKATATTPQRPIKRKVEPLLTCKWSQYDPFNKYTPLSNGQHTPTGCVATATAQVMFYNKWPKNRPQDYIASTGDDAKKSATYWWDEMKNTTNDMRTEHSRQAVGVLMSDIGKAVNMRYYYRGSDSNLQYACNALRDKFDYTVRYLDKNFLPANDFLNEVMQEISDGYPVLVVGGPHAFVYDGYDEQGLIHTNWGWGGENDGYFDINIVTLNVSGFALSSGTFWDDISVVFAHPNDGKATPFKDIERGLDARTTTSLTIDKTEANRSESFSAKIERLGSYSSVKGELGVFTGKVALALYNDKNEQVKIFNSTASDQTWASIFTSMSFDVADINFKGIADGNYRLVPVFSEMLDTKTKEHGDWKPINHANEIEVKLTPNAVQLNTNNPKDVVVIEKAPSLLAPYYEGSGFKGAYSFTMYNPGREEVRGKLVMTLTNQETKKEYNGYLLTPNVVAQRLGRTTFVINMLPLYYNKPSLGNLPRGKYDVTLSIKVNRKGTETIIPIDMKEPFEIEVLPYINNGNIELTFLDYYVDNAHANYSTFNLDKIKNISLQVHSKVTGYQIRNGYRGPIHYRLLDLTSNKWIDLGTINNVYLPCDADNNAAQTRITFAASQLEPNHSYEIHLELERNGQRQDTWNPLVLRNVFNTISDLNTPTGINSVNNNQNTAKNIFTLQGIRLSKTWEELPAGIYIIDGKKVIKK